MVNLLETEVEVIPHAYAYLRLEVFDELEEGRKRGRAPHIPVRVRTGDPGYRLTWHGCPCGYVDGSVVPVLCGIDSRI